MINTQNSRSVSGTQPRPGPILVVDDYDDARGALRDALEERGYAVIEAANGQEALTFLASRPDANVRLILLDLQMPVMDGWQFLKVLRSYVRLASIPVIVVSAHAHRFQAAQDPGVVGCLHAPRELDQLLRLVATCALPSHPPPRLGEA
jgi:CheY-like chemotaxis protein